MAKLIELKPIKPKTDGIEALEKAIIRLLRKELFGPLLKELQEPQSVLKNALNDLLEAILAGKVRFDRGTFSGKFNSAISKELRDQGAKWDRKTGTFKIHWSRLNIETKNAISASKYRLEQKIKAIDKKIAQIIPDKLLENLRVEHILDKQIYDLDKQFQGSLKNITIAPKFTEADREKIRKEYSENLKLDIKRWMDEEVISLRKSIDKNVLEGLRYENLVPTIMKSYGVGVNKARFLARQETNLLTTKMREIRYTSAGVNKYRWQAVAGTPAHPTRPRHKQLSGTIHDWDNPPIVTEPDDPTQRRAHPGQDFNCRCIAIPIISKET